MSSKFLIPGHPASTNGFINYDDPVEIGKVSFKSHTDQQLFVPNVVAEINPVQEDPKNNTITVNILSIIGSAPENLSFQYFYDFTLSNTGENNYRLLVYLMFTEIQLTPPQNKEYFMYSSKIVFEEGSLLSADRKPIPLNLISAAEVFMIKEDPVTSRGTETTVQPGVGNG